MALDGDHGSGSSRIVARHSPRRGDREDSGTWDRAVTKGCGRIWLMTYVPLLEMVVTQGGE